MPKTKTCTNPNCDQPIKPATPEYFHRDPTQPDGLRGECKVCRNKKERPKRVGKYQKKERRSLTTHERAVNLTDEFLSWWNDRRPRFIEALEETIARAVEMEREECLKILENSAALSKRTGGTGPIANAILKDAITAIRKRGGK